jgi:hypothetical protein
MAVSERYPIRNQRRLSISRRIYLYFGLDVAAGNAGCSFRPAARVISRGRTGDSRCRRLPRPYWTVGSLWAADHHLGYSHSHP